MLLYRGMKVELKDTTVLVGSLATDYARQGYLYLKGYDDKNNTAFVINSMVGGIGTTTKIDNVVPVYDKDMQAVLELKEKELKVLEREIKDIREFINSTCRNA